MAAILHREGIDGNLNLRAGPVASSYYARAAVLKLYPFESTELVGITADNQASQTLISREILQFIFIFIIIQQGFMLWRPDAPTSPTRRSRFNKRIVAFEHQTRETQ